MYNWINPSGTPYWRGTYKCIFEKCPVRYLAKIESISFDSQYVEIAITKCGIPNHVHRINKTQQIRGEARERLAERVCADGVSNTLNKHILFNRTHKQGIKIR